MRSTVYSLCGCINYALWIYISFYSFSTKLPREAARENSFARSLFPSKDFSFRFFFFFFLYPTYSYYESHVSIISRRSSFIGTFSFPLESRKDKKWRECLGTWNHVLYVSCPIGLGFFSFPYSTRVAPRYSPTFLVRHNLEKDTRQRVFDLSFLRKYVEREREREIIALGALT